jgi:hypothetical protein
MHVWIVYFVYAILSSLVRYAYSQALRPIRPSVDSSPDILSRLERRGEPSPFDLSSVETFLWGITGIALTSCPNYCLHRPVFSLKDCSFTDRFDSG